MNSPSVVVQQPILNQILATLPNDAYLRLLADMEPVEMPLGMVLCESDAKLSHVYFPTNSIVSLLYVMENGASAEIAVIGRDGFVGVHLMLGSETTPSRAVVQSSGQGYRIKVNALMREFSLGKEFQRIALSYTQALITQMAQTAVCNRHHTVEQQLCRWLLLSIDRLTSNELMMTQELIANMLGVRREGVTEAAGRLQADGLISYTRGHITVLDRPALEERVCECYAVVKKEHKRLIPSPDTTTIKSFSTHTLTR